MIYQIYVTDALGAITNNTARFAGGSVLNKRYYDFIDAHQDEPQRSSEDIIKSISDQLDQLGKEEDDECI